MSIEKTSEELEQLVKDLQEFKETGIIARIHKAHSKGDKK